MKKRTPLGIAAATLLVASQIGSPAIKAEAASPHHAMQVQKMVEANQIDDLVAYIRANPALARGQGALARSLRDFMSAVERGTVFSFDATTMSGVAQAVSRAAEQSVFGGNRTSLY